MRLEPPLQQSRDYFTPKIEKLGSRPEGMDYNSAPAQLSRFAQLVKVIYPSRPFDILDYGCGCGAPRDYMPGQRWVCALKHCKRSYAPNVALLHDYGLHDFTSLVGRRI